jgi:hypothetical protein
VWKVSLKALPIATPASGEYGYYPDFNITCKNKQGVPLVNEVKKVGVIIDRG